VNDFLQHAEQSIRDRRVLKRGSQILVAVSGGMDSMALLHVLRALAGEWRWELTVAHFNHRLRGRSSGADERLVRQTATKMKLPIEVERADAKGFAVQSKLSIEMAARKLRHEFFARTAKQRGIRTVALAHHADDQVELFFLRLLRGAGGEGLAGMKWRSPSPVDGAITLARPLLDVTKAALREFARENRIRFRDDATNFSLAAPRNRIRNELLPLLRRNYQPALTNAVLRLMEIVGAESDFVREAAREWMEKNKTALGAPASSPASGNSPTKHERAGGKPATQGSETPHVVSGGFERLPAAIQRRVLQWQLTKLGVPADFELIERLRDAAGRAISVNSTLSVLREANGTVKLRVQERPGFNPHEMALALAGKTGKAEFDGVRVRWTLQSGNAMGRGFRPTGSPKQIQREFFDADRVGKTITLRHWRPGDRFRPIGSPSAVKLQDWFVNQKIPAARRRELMVAVAENGELFWIEGLRIGENFKLTPKTWRKLAWTWSRTN
jgi:tRNA(Ile)-lysidine synthase